MSVLSRIIQPVTSAVLAIVILGITLYFRPVGENVGAARSMPEGHVDMLPRSAETTQPRVPYDSTFDSIVMTAWIGGLLLILCTSLYLIWFRLRTTPGRHRAAA